jgi:hypothetical protein
MHKSSPITILALSVVVLGLFVLAGCSGVSTPGSSGSSGSGGTGSGGSGGGGTGGGGTGGGGTGGGGGQSGGATGADFYVATDGNDSWSGTLAAPNAGNTDGPFATIAKAQTAVQGILSNPQGRTQTILVQIRQGTYFLAQPLSFTAADSGTSQLQVNWENYPAETPSISGGVQLGAGSGLSWQNIGGNEWQVSLPASTQYFEQLFYNQQRRLRPRLGGSLGAYYRVAATIYLAGSSSGPAPDPNCSVYVSGSGWECFDRFQYSPSDPISASWTNLNSPYPAGDIEVYDFEKWMVAKLRIKSIDTNNSIIYFTGPTYQENPDFGFIVNHRYVVENVKDDLTQAGQWFLDRSASPWTLTYLANTGENPNTDSVIVPQASQVMIATGLQYVTFTGLTFEHDNFIVPAVGYPSLRQDPGITGALTCFNCQNVTFNGDIVTQTSGGGIELYTNNTSAATANNVVENAGLYDLGAFGIRVGLPGVYTDTDANVPHNTTIQNTLIASYGRVFPSAIGLLQGDGHDNTYTQNDIYDGYHSTIEVCALACPWGTQGSHGSFNNITEFNHTYNVGQGMTDDLGCIYYNTGGPNHYGTGNKILNNKCHDVTDASTQDSDGYGGQGIYLDAETAAVTVENNLVYRVSSQTMNMSNGPAQAGTPNVIQNNIFAYGRMGIFGLSAPYSSNSCPTAPIVEFNAMDNIAYFDKKYTDGFSVQKGCTYSCGFAYTQFQMVSGNLYWRTDGAFATDSQAFHIQPNPSSPLCDTLNTSGTDWNYYTFSGWQGVGEDVQGTAQTNPGFVNAAYPADDYTLPSSPIAGFVVFDPSQAGRQSPVIQAPTISPTFITAPLNPATDY